MAACDKLGWHPFMDYPTDIYISEREKGKFLCQIHSSIFYSRRAGEVAMELLDKDRFTNHFLTLGYAAKCQNLNAYYRIGRNLAGADTKRAQEILSYIDVLVDGPFVEEKKNIRLVFRGSENQRVLNLKET